MQAPATDPRAVTGDAAGSGEPVLARLVDQVRAARADRSALCIRGAGTKDFYGGAPRGAALEMRPLSGICSYEPTEMVITARGGTPLSEVEAALAEAGQCLAFEPPRFASEDGHGGTIGGAVAAGLSGPARISSGALRDFVLGTVLLNGRGEVLRFGGQVMKNVAGYDVSRVLAGSMGVLGAICEVSLKVLPLPPASATLVFSCPQAAAIERVHQWAAQALPINASTWRAGYLHLRLSGALAAVRAGVTRLAREFDGREMDEALAADFWQRLRDQRDEFFLQARKALDGTGAEAGATVLWRISVPSSRPPLDLPGEVLLEWGGAQRWFLGALPASQVRALAAAAGGHATAFRSRERPQDFLSPLPLILERFHKSLKYAFDPEGIFNPGRLYSWL
jgi:glycolate oxidase FAD binding subunit